MQIATGPAGDSTGQHAAPRPGRVVVGYDGSPDADLALAWAAGAATAQGRRLEVVVAETDMDPVFGDVQREADASAAQTRDRATQQLARLGLPTEQPGGEARACVDVRRGPTVPVLLAAAQDASMIVLGSPGHGAIGGSLMSVSQHVARHAPCPVVTVREPHDPHAARILVGLDGSAESRRALAFACEVAAGAGRPVVGLYGYRPFHAATGAAVDLHSVEMARRIEEAERLVASWIAPAAAAHADVDVTAEAVGVPAAQALVDGSAEAGLVVVGSRGRDAFAELLLGSVSQHVLREARCPVAVVR